jgi:uncharacterized phiE125 gp8 family phage protein
MGITALTQPACEPITTDEALAHCRIDADTEDGLVAGYMMAARTFVENLIGRPLIRRSYLYTLDYGWPLLRYSTSMPYWTSNFDYYRTRIELPKSPIGDPSWIEVVTYIDVDGNGQTLDPTQYVIIVDGVVPYIEPAYNVYWPPTRDQPQAISVQFDAGYGAEPGDIPDNIRHALLMLVAYWYDNRGSAQFGARAKTSDVTSMIMPAEVPPGVMALLTQDQMARIL